MASNNNNLNYSDNRNEERIATGIKHGARTILAFGIITQLSKFFKNLLKISKKHS